jgi:hypothetical protein
MDMKSLIPFSGYRMTFFKSKKVRCIRVAADAHQGMVTAKWSTTAGNRHARCYQLTATGRKQLLVEMSQIERVIGAITRVIRAV